MDRRYSKMILRLIDQAITTNREIDIPSAIANAEAFERARAEFVALIAESDKRNPADD